MGGRVRSPDPEGSPRRRLRRRRQGGGGRGRYHRFQPHDQHQLAHALILQRRVLVALAGTGLFIAALDAYVVVTLLPAMMSDIGLTIERLEQATPIVTGFSPAMWSRCRFSALTPTCVAAYPFMWHASRPLQSVRS